MPVAVGFGIGTPEQARMVAEAGADGVIIGSRLVRAAADADEPAEAVGALVHEFATVLRDSSAGRPGPRPDSERERASGQSRLA